MPPENSNKGFVFTTSRARREKFKNEPKGFVFTIDAMVGAAIITFVILSFSFTVQQPTRNEVFLDRMAVDTLAVLEERGTVDTESITTINDTIRQLLPQSVAYTFRVEYFNVTATGGLTLINTMQANFIPESRDVVYQSRPVPVLRNESTNIQIKNTTVLAKVRLGVALA